MYNHKTPQIFGTYCFFLIFAVFNNRNLHDYEENVIFGNGDVCCRTCGSSGQCSEVD